MQRISTGPHVGHGQVRADRIAVQSAGLQHRVGQWVMKSEKPVLNAKGKYMLHSNPARVQI